MSKEVFRTVQVGDTVHYLTPQGQNGKGKVVIHAGEHVVVNRGKGQPQVVTDKNYSHHTRGGKVIGALLSNLAQHGANERRAKKAAAALKATNAASPYKIGEPQMNAAKAFGWVKEDRSEAEGRGARVEKTKKKEKAKKLHEVSTSTLASYVTKALADRKKAKSGFDIAGRIWDGERKEKAQAKAFKRIDKRTVGIQKAVGKIASQLPSEPLKAHTESEGSKHGGWSGMNEVAAPGKEAWIKANKARFIAKYGKEKGTKILYAKAWKDAKNESVVNEGERAGQARAAERSWVSDLADKSPNLSKGAGKPEPGYHYRVGGKTVSVHAHPQDALAAYKKGGSTGKIVHVKEGVETDVTTQILSEDKVKQAAQKAISLAKKAKGNKHVDTKPSLDIVDKGTHGPIEGNEEGGHSASL